MNVALIAPSAALRLRLGRVLQDAAPLATVREHVVAAPHDVAAHVRPDDDVAVLAFGRTLRGTEEDELDALRSVPVPTVLIVGPRSSGYHRAAWELGVHALLSLEQHSLQALIGSVRAALRRTEGAASPAAASDAARVLAARPDATVVAAPRGARLRPRIEKRYRLPPPLTGAAQLGTVREAAFAWNALDAGVTVLDVFARDEDLVLVFEPLGPALDEHLVRDRPLDERVHWFQSLADAVHRMHAAAHPHGALALRRARLRADGPVWLEPARLRPPGLFAPHRAATGDVTERLQEDLDALGAVFVELCLPGAAVGDDGRAIAWAMPVLEACSAPRRGRATRTARAIAEACREVGQRLGFEGPRGGVAPAESR